MKAFYKLSVVVILFALLSIPDNNNAIHLSEKENLAISSKWWGKFAQNLVKYRITPSQNQAYQYKKHRSLLVKKLDNLLLDLADPNDQILDSISFHINKLSALASLVPGTIYEFEQDVASWRKLLKYQSRYWDTSSDYANTRRSKFIVESRLAFESALIQSKEKYSNFSASKKSSSPHFKIVNNITFESGDIIAYNLKTDKNPYASYIKELPNLHKHLGSVHINDTAASVIYIDLEKGLTVTALDNFIDLAPNGVTLRLRDDLPDILRNPLLPSLAANNMYKMALSNAYKYDYNFNSNNHDYVYDWEFIDLALRNQGLTVNMDMYHRNSASIYVGHRDSHITPSEIEIDHRFSLVGEWYSSDLLYKNRLITATTAAMLEHQEKDSFINPILLPGYRFLKAYSMLMGAFGLHEPIPAGITAQTQLVINTLEAKRSKLVIQLRDELLTYEEARNHRATYLKIIQKADEIVFAQTND